MTIRVLTLANYLIKFLVVAIVAWIGIHIMAGFGIFIALGYLIFWLIEPTKTPDLLHRNVLQNQESPEPIHFKDAIRNTFILIAISALSVVLIFGEIKLIQSLDLAATEKTVFFEMPSEGQYLLGEVFPLEIYITGIETPINAIRADMVFDNKALEVMDISVESSFANIFIQSEYNNEKGLIRVAGGIPNPGFKDESGIFATLFLKGKKPGITKIDFSPTSLVLANDGHGTNVIKELAHISLIILPEKVSGDDEKSQTILLTGSVKGESTEKTEGTKIVLYEKQSSVLGSKTDEALTNAEKTEENEDSNEKSFINFIYKFDCQVMKTLENFSKFIQELFAKIFNKAPENKQIQNFTE